PRLLRHVLGIFAMTPPDAADTLVMLAGLARRKGLLVVEQHHALARLPVFHEGVRLMLAGHRPAAIREALAATAAPPTRAITFQHLLQPLGLTAAAVALALLVAGGADPSTLPFAPPILALALLAAATALPLSAHGPF